MRFTTYISNMMSKLHRIDNRKELRTVDFRTK